MNCRFPALLMLVGAVLVVPAVPAAQLAAGRAAAGGAGGAVPDAGDMARMTSGSRVGSGLDLISGVIGSIDLSRHVLTLEGQTVAWDPDRLRVFTTTGVSVDPGSLRRGQRIRFALDGSAAAVAAGQPRRIVLIYLEGAR
jgi:hypothetical protein